MTFELRVFAIILFVVIAAVFGAALKWRAATIAWLARWAAPIIMGLAYLMLMITSDTDATGKAWMTIGFGIVLVVWVLIRLLTARAALARALAVGDTERILEVATRELARKTDGLARAPLLLARAFAFEISGDWPKVIGALDEISLTTPLSPRAQALQHETAARRAGALVELGQVATARAAVDTLPAPTPLAPNAIDQMVAQLTHTLARGRVLVAEGKPDEARRALEAITKNIRATELQRATAHYYLAAISGETAAATHRLAVARFAPRSWMNQNRPA